MNDIFFHGIWRMDWGFGNPNKTAACIAILMIAVWVFAYFRRWGFWLALAVFVGLGVALVHTFSRGGLISLLAGIIPLLIWAPRPWPRSKLIGGIIGLWIIVGASIYLKAHERYTQGVAVEDQSISNRIQLWKTAPAMMANAPEGWGFGKAGNAYMQWYQPLNQNETYRTLVNSHLTWLVEFGWPLRLLYILGWSSVLMICWPSRFNRWRAIALGVWLCFFVAAFFSSVAESWIMWIVPSLFLLAAILQRVFARQYPSRTQWLLPVGATILLAIGIWSLGQISSSLHGSKNLVIIGRAEPKMWICYDSTTMGSLYGKSLRAAYQPKEGLRPESAGLLFSTGQFPKLSGKTLVIGSVLPDGGNNGLKAAVRDCHRLILLNPRFFPQEIGIDSSNKEKVTTYFGDFSQSPSIEAWRSASNWEQLPGMGDFFPNWTSYIFAKSDAYGKR
jgi:hypothetical protein